jgi:hypothetical protein
MDAKLRIAGGRDVDLHRADSQFDADLDDLNNHISRARKLFKPIQPSNLEYEIIRAKEINREARALLGFD